LYCHVAFTPSKIFKLIKCNNPWGNLVASCSEIESWLSVLGTGIAGLRLFKMFGVQNSELEFFMENFGDMKIEVSAFAPPPLRNQYEITLKQAESELREKIQEMRAQTVDSEVSDEMIDSVLKNAENLFSLLRDMHQATVSGFIIV